MMIFTVIVYSLFGAMCIWFVVSGIRKINQVKESQSLSDLYTSEEEHDRAIKEANSFEMNYFERVRNGEQTQLFLAVGAQSVSSLVRSLLFAGGIPTYAENEHINSLYSLNNLGAANSFSIKIFILVADYDKAKEIVDDFISKSLSEYSEEEENQRPPTKKVAGAVTTFLLFSSVIPEDAEDRAMGITVYPKADTGIMREE